MVAAGYLFEGAALGIKAGLSGLSATGGDDDKIEAWAAVVRRIFKTGRR